MHDPAPSMINLLLHIFMFLHLMLQNFINDLYAKIVLGNWFSISSLSFRSKMVGKIILLLKNYVKSRYFHNHQTKIWENISQCSGPCYRKIPGKAKGHSFIHTKKYSTTPMYSCTVNRHKF